MALNSSEIDELISALLENKEYNFPLQVLKETTRSKFRSSKKYAVDFRAVL